MTNLDLQPKINNPYIEAFNKHFNFRLEMRAYHDDDGGLPGEPMLSIGEMVGKAYFAEMFVIAPYEKDEFSDLGNDSEHKQKKYQLLGFEFHCSRDEPPSGEEYEIGNYDSLQSAICALCKLMLQAKFDSIMAAVYLETFDTI